MITQQSKRYAQTKEKVQQQPSLFLGILALLIFAAVLGSLLLLDVVIWTELWSHIK